MTRIGVLSDTHISSPRQSLPPQLLEDFASVDLILHAGDWVDACVLRQLEALAEVIGVRGNMDHPSISSNLPEIQQLDRSGYKIGLIHGSGSSSGIERRIRGKFQPLPDLIIFGHTHQAVLKRDGDVLFFNPGSPTDQVFAAQRSYGLVELGAKIEARIVSLP